MTVETPRHSWRAYKEQAGDRYGHVHRRIKRELMKADPSCKNCGRPGEHADHIKPLCLGGATIKENIQILCVDCSRKKTAAEANHVRWHVKRRHLDRGNGATASKKAQQ